MVKLRLSVMGQTDRETMISDGETLDRAIGYALRDVPLDSREPGEVFRVFVNGLKIETELWEHTKLSISDNVLIAPDVKGTDDGNIFRQVLVLAISVTASIYLGPYVGGGIYGALAVAGATLAGGLLVNSLIPPSVPDGLNSSFNLPDSQMYSITSQSNAVRKFDTVPKVYGTYRMFPPIAANPYTDLEADPTTGELVSYFYAIYDFGLGPVNVNQIQIGDTPITDFTDVYYAQIDPVGGTTPGGYKPGTNTTFRYYKGDAHSDSSAYVLAGNRDQPDEKGNPYALADYQVIRNSALNQMNGAQSILLSFVNPKGLYGIRYNGDIVSKTVNLTIEFAKVGTDDWHAYNDESYVSDYSNVGGDTAFTPTFIRMTAMRGPGAPDPVYDYLGRTDYNYIYYGFAAGRQDISVAELPSGLAVGSTISILGTRHGKVASITYGGVFYGEDRWFIHLEKPLPQAITIFTYYQNQDTSYTPISGNTYETLAYATVILGTAVITGASTSPVYSTVKFTPLANSQFKVRITRTSTQSNYLGTGEDSLTLGSITTRFDRSPIDTDKIHNFLELRIKATDQINGAIQNLSAVCTSVLDVWDGTQWIKKETNNPAWVFCDLLTGQANKRSIDKSRLHLPSILEWAAFCDEVPASPAGTTFTQPRFQCNFVLDYATTLQGVINQVTSAAQASMNIVDGKYGILIDRRRYIPVQIFTPRNSRDFSSVRNYTTRPDAITVKFTDPDTDWQVAEAYVYDQNQTSETALTFDELTSFGCTNWEQAWRYGRYMLAQNRLRQETISLTVDFEYLVCSRGDYVQITQDIIKVGGSPARVKSISGRRIQIDDEFDTLNVAYGFVFRAINGQIYQNTLTVIDSDTFDLDGTDFPQVGDLIVIGEVGKVVYDCIVKGITPNDDLTAQITLVEKADAIYDAESTDTFAPYDPQINQTTDATFASPNEVSNLTVADNNFDCAGNGYEYSITLTWDATPGPAYDVFQIFVSDGTGYQQVAYTKQLMYRYIVNPTRLGLVHSFKVVAVSASGKKLDLGSVSAVTATPMSKTSPPSSIDTLSTDITGEVLQLIWSPIPDCDCQQYILRYSPDTLTASWGASIPLVRVASNVNSAAVQARTGTYFIKALDFNGNESSEAAEAITTIPNLFGLNIITETTDFPALTGSKDRVQIVGGDLVLKKKVVGGIDTGEYYSEGYYYFNKLLDLGGIYTARLQSLIQAEGYTDADLMSNWVKLSDVTALSGARHDDWDVETQYRGTNTLNVMSAWTKLSNVSTLSGGQDDDFTPWRKFIMGDATARILQFRLRLVSNKVSVTPRVFDGKIRIDMPDRTESYNNLVAPTTGYVLTYAPAFAGPDSSPNIQISIDGAQSGDYWTIVSKTLEGFKVIFYDKNNNPVSRQFDAAVRGFGFKATSTI